MKNLRITINKYIHVSIIISLAFFIIHPVMTEHVEFALFASSQITISDFNNFNFSRLGDSSSQIIIPEIFLRAKLNPNWIQLVMSFFCTFLPIVTTIYFLNFISQTQRLHISIMILIISLLMIVNPLNKTLYPWALKSDFFAFGNQGMWMAFFSITLMLIKRNFGYFLAGFIISWHIVWAVPPIIFLAVTIKKINKENLIFFIIGLLVSLFLFYYHNNSFSILHESFQANHGIAWLDANKSFLDSLLSPKLIEHSIWTQHNPILYSQGKINFNYILVMTIPVSYIFYLKKNVINIPSEVFIFFLALTGIVFTSLTYIEIAKNYPLPLANIIFRAIPNRYLNLMIAINILYSLYIIMTQFTSNKFNKPIFFKFILVSICFFLFFYPNKLIIFLSTLLFFLYFIKVYRPRFKNFFIFLFAVLLGCIFTVKSGNEKFNAMGFLSPNKIEAFLMSDLGKHKRYIISKGIQSFNGINIGLLAQSDYFQPMPFLINSKTHQKINLYCFPEFGDKLWDVDSCFTTRSREEWKSLLEILNVDYVIVHDNIYLNMNLILKADGLSIYKVLD
jgi:hypothetical protein